MADLIIPATLRIWLIFLLVFVLLRYPVPFSIVFGGIAGLAGGIATAWWQVKGGAPTDPKDRPPVDQIEPTVVNDREITSRWEIPFLKRNPAKARYVARVRRARNRRL